jgi:hypothetical protein
MFLSGKRKLTLDQVRRLNARFRLPADVFLVAAYDESPEPTHRVRQRRDEWGTVWFA